jgi:hypothetical protein
VVETQRCESAGAIVAPAHLRSELCPAASVDTFAVGAHLGIALSNNAFHAKTTRAASWLPRDACAQQKAIARLRTRPPT